MKIEGCVALVTGANRGLGQALVEALIVAGARKIYAAARDESKVLTSDPRVVPLRLDTTNPELIAAAAARANDVNLLVNNAGVLSSFRLLGGGSAALAADFRTNVFGMLDVVRAFLPVLARAERAAIVNVLSLASLASVPTMGGYSASKAAAYSITQALRAELGAQRIEVLAALPGPIDTDMVKSLDLPKASPTDVARGIVRGIAGGEEEIFPDPMAAQMGELWRSSPKEYERALGRF
ncbi:MAG: SDR family NAD(P)-dependent oxidoreductase [Myxococcales bacterium]|nr:MAG: SDR family NAD(P)-dependent oxidoreductase [Myxococcales bacterium]